MKEHGYDGVEMTTGFFAAKFYPNLPLKEVAIKAREAADAHGMSESLRSCPFLSSCCSSCG